MTTPAPTPTSQEAALRAVRGRYERGEIGFEEFRRAFDALLKTTDPAACQAILDGLTPAPGQTLATLDRAFAAPATPPTPRVPGFRLFFLLLGEIAKTRRPWRLGRLSLGLMVVGETTLDLRLAALPANGTLVYLSVIGETTIILPKSVNATVTAFTLIGESNALGESSSGFFTFTHESDPGHATAAGQPAHLHIVVLGAIGEITIEQREDRPQPSLAAATPHKELT